MASLARVKPIDLVPTVIGEMKGHHRENGWAGVSLQDARPACGQPCRRWARSSAGHRRPERSPSSSVSREEVVEAFDAARSATSAASLDVEVEHDGEQSDTLGTLIGGDDAGDDRVEDRAALGALHVVDDRDRLILGLRYGDELTRAQIGRIVWVSQMQISRLLAAALARLHNAMEPDDRLAA